MASDVVVKVRLPRELVDRLDKQARGRGVYRSTLIRMLLYATLERPQAAAKDAA